jgi:hypothetical protein
VWGIWEGHIGGGGAEDAGAVWEAGPAGNVRLVRAVGAAERMGTFGAAQAGGVARTAGAAEVTGAKRGFRGYRRASEWEGWAWQQVLAAVVVVLGGTEYSTGGAEESTDGAEGERGYPLVSTLGLQVLQQFRLGGAAPPPPRACGNRAHIGCGGFAWAASDEAMATVEVGRMRAL